MKRFLVEIPEEKFAELRRQITWCGRYPQTDSEIVLRVMNDGLVPLLHGPGDGIEIATNGYQVSTVVA